VHWHDAAAKLFYDWAGDDKVKSLGPDMFLDFVLHYETFRDQLPSPWMPARKQAFCSYGSDSGF
jgi:hypothetical protein